MSSVASTSRSVVVVGFGAMADNVGRSSVVANAAWVFAAAGKAVLVLDWSAQQPRIQEYLAPFTGPPRAVPRALEQLFGARQPGEEAPFDFGICTAPGLEGRIEVLTRRTARYRSPDRWPVPLAEIRTALAGADYDYVLIDAPTAEHAVIAALCQWAVLCFRPRPEAIESTAAAGIELRRLAPVKMDVLPVVTHFDLNDSGAVEWARTAIRKAFRNSVDGDLCPVELPRPHDSFAPMLDILVEEPGSRAHVQYGRLIGLLTSGRVPSVPQAAVDPVLRQRYRRLFRLDTSREPDRVLLAYAPHDRPWADWVRDQFVRAGAEVGVLGRDDEWLRREEPPGVAVVLSRHLDRTAVQEALIGYRGLVRTLVVDDDLREPGDGLPLTATDVGDASAVLAPFGLIARPVNQWERAARKPGTVPRVVRLPPRPVDFIGRDGELERLRDLLVADERPLARLTGSPGVGKSALALEYAYRFAADYDVVWWLQAQNRGTLLEGLDDLARRLREVDTEAEQSSAAELLRSPRFRRFLLVYDDVDDVTTLDDLLPSSDFGHVLVVTNDAAQGGLELAWLPSDDSAHLLGELAPGLRTEDSLRIADAVDHLPLALELAGRWLRERVEWGRHRGGSTEDSAKHAVDVLLDVLPPRGGRAGNHAVNRILAVIVETLGQSPPGRLSVLLARFFSHLSPEGIGLRFARSTALLDRLAVLLAEEDDAWRLRQDSFELDRALWTGDRYGLFQVDWGKSFSVRMHRVVQRALKEAMDEEPRVELRQEVLACLAAYAPNELEETAAHRAGRFRELQRHIVASGALTSDDLLVRRWLVNQVRFLFTNQPRAVQQWAVDHGGWLLERWTERFGLGDPLRNRLAAQLANIHRSLGDAREAERLDEVALTHQRRTLERASPQTLITARGLGGDLRGLGRFTEAVAEDKTTWEGFRAVLGEDHPETVRAANNLALSLFLSGDTKAALVTEQDNYQRRLRLFGEDYVGTWSSYTRIGVYQCELGDLTTALRTLRTATQRLAELTADRRNQRLLSAQWAYAIALRNNGRLRAAKNRNDLTLAGFRSLLGRSHPVTLACQVSHAADLRIAGDTGAAVTMTADALHRFLTEVRLAPDHPFVSLTRLGHGLALMRHGDRAEAAREARAAADALRTRLNDVHPWSLAAEITVALVEDQGSVVDVITAVHDRCANYLGPNHPYTGIAAANVEAALSGKRLGREIDVDIPQT